MGLAKTLFVGMGLGLAATAYAEPSTRNLDAQQLQQQVRDQIRITARDTENQARAQQHTRQRLRTMQEQLNQSRYQYQSERATRYGQGFESRAPAASAGGGFGRPAAAGNRGGGRR